MEDDGERESSEETERRWGGGHKNSGDGGQPHKQRKRLEAPKSKHQMRNQMEVK
jgi:hypothetical protein